MSGWIVLAVYVAGWVFVYRKAFVVIAESEGDEDKADRAFAGYMAMIVATLWPLTVTGYWVWRLLSPKTLGQRRREVEERERRVAELERELNIKKDAP